MTGILYLYVRISNFSICCKQLIHTLVAAQREHARQCFDDSLGTDSITAGLKRCVNAHMGRINSIHGFRTHIQLQAYIIRHGIYKVTTLSNNRVYTHYILLAEGFTQSVYAHQAQAGSIQRVDTFMRSVGCMSGFTDIANSFTYKAVAAFTDRNRRLRHIFIGMHLHGHINIIKSAHKMQLARLH